MKKNSSSFLIAVFIVLFAPVVAYAEVSQTIIEELGDAMTKAENTRKMAADFEGPSYFPGEWENAEALYIQVSNMPKDTDEDAKKVVDVYNTVAELFEAVLALTIPLYAQAREDEIMALRGELITAGARDLHPEFFTPADTEAVLALEQFEANDLYTARDTAASALSMYDVLKTAYNVRLVRQDIIERGFENNNPEEFDRADEFFSSAMDAFTAKNIPGTQTNLDEALQIYNAVLGASWTEYAKLHSLLVENERQAALDLRADIAAENIFSEADFVHENAKSLFESQSYEEASMGFILAESLYIGASTAASEKRSIAGEAIQKAETKIEEVIRAAR